MSDANTPFLRLSGVSKHFGGVRALQGVDFACRRGSIHAILGENGAGKSTLIKTIAGVEQPDDGRIELDGQAITLSSPRDALDQRLVCVFQELSLLPDLTVADNICITNAPGWGGFIASRAQHNRAVQLLAEVGCRDVDPSMLCKDLPLSRRQMVEIAKALGRDPQLLILDEATSALTAADVEQVYRLLFRLRDRGMSILYISHRMHEIEALADTCSVFREGRHIETFPQGEKSADEIIRLMIGRDITQVYPPRTEREPAASVALKTNGLSWTDRLQDVSLSVRRGEIVGLGGLDGQGQRELLLSLFGVLRDVRGTVEVGGKPTQIDSPRAAKASGIDLAMVPEDRKSEGLMLPLSVRENLTLAAVETITRGGAIDRKAEADLVDAAVGQLRIKIDTIDDAVGGLSGGNQQKVVIAKWLATKPEVLLLMDPTRGIDVGTKQELYQLLHQLAAGGTAVLLYSTDYDELIGMCDRVLIMYQGQITTELVGEQITEEAIVASALNIGETPGTAAAVAP
ncbi:MAG: sugar ABC transporter ATP-binding protein [Alphaproteobacteria bacterium]